MTTATLAPTRRFAVVRVRPAPVIEPPYDDERTSREALMKDVARGGFREAV